MKLLVVPCLIVIAALGMINYCLIGMDEDKYVNPTVATFSIVGYDPKTGDLGVAVQSKFFGVGSVVPWAKAGVGAIATQALANTTYGPEGLKLLEKGLSPEEVIKKLTSEDEGVDFRQIGIVDAKGRAASFTGKKAQEWRGHITGVNFACQGNILAGEDVVKRMSQAFQFTEGDLADKLLATLKAAQSAGGDKRGKQSAAILVVRKDGGYAGWNDRYIDLRVEDSKNPIEELGRLLKLHRMFFRNVPVPGDEKGELALGGDGSPEAIFNKWKMCFLNGIFQDAYELYSSNYKNRISKEDFIKTNNRSQEANKKALEVLIFVKALIDNDVAIVYFRHVGTNRPNTMKMIKENGQWRIDR